MNEGGTGDFSKHPREEQERYRTIHRQMTKFSRDHAIPITYAPPIKTFSIPLDGAKVGRVTLPLSLGKIETASGCVLQLQSECFIVTAEHVLEDYEDRLHNGEVLDWQVGKLPPFDPLPRVAWRGSSK